MSSETVNEIVVVEETEGDVVKNPTIFNALGFWLPHVFLMGYVFVILAAIYTQFFEDEMPCPLCMLQRMGMILACIGPLWIIARVRNGQLTHVRYVCAYGMSILSVMLGASISVRQILLHILPGDPGYGDVVLGFHLYTWALVTFLVVIVYCAVMMMFSKSTYPVAPTGKGARMISTIIIVIFLLLILTNLLLVFAEEGFHWTLPDDPTTYLLFNPGG